MRKPETFRAQATESPFENRKGLIRNVVDEIVSDSSVVYVERLAGQQACAGPNS